MTRPALAALLALAAGPSAAATLTYFGGPVIENAKVYVVWWGPPSDLNPVLTGGTLVDFVKGLLDSPYVDMLNQYDTNIAAQGGARAGLAGTGQHIGRGNLAGVYELRDVPPGSVSDAIVVNTLLSAIAKGELPAADANSIYGIFFPIAVHIDNSCQRGGFAAYHGATNDNAPDGVVYMVFPDCGFTFEDYGNVVSHELAESITDRAPTPGDVPDFPQAWNDAKAFEIADLCDSAPSATAVTPLGQFPVEALWDELGGGCHVGHVYPQDYNLSVAPKAVDLQPGGSVSIAIATATTGGAAQTVALSVSAPTGVTGSFDRASIVTGETATLTLTADPDGSFERDSQVVVIAQGTNGSSPQRHTASLLVQPPEFDLLVGKAAKDLDANGTTTIPISIAGLYGDPGAIDLSISGLPAKVTGTFSPIAGGAAALTLKASGAATLSNAQAIVTARGAAVVHTGTAIFSIVPSPGGCSSGADAGVLVLLGLLAWRRRR